MLDLLIYLDENLIKNLNSLALNGYIDIRTFKKVRDRSVGGIVSSADKDGKSWDSKEGKDKIEGYKTKHKNYANSSYCGNERSLEFEGKNFDRNEQEIKKINTSFTFHSDLLNFLKRNNSIKNIVETNNLRDISIGDYIEIKGNVQETSIFNYIDTLLKVFNCYGYDFLNSLINDNKEYKLNYTIIANLLTELKNSITVSETRDLIIKSGNTFLVLPVNENYFLDSHFNMFDIVHCSCKVFGKVMMVKEDKAKCISLLRKSSQESYYEELLNSIDPYLRLLERNNIILPKKVDCNIKGKMIMILPISICI
ncbi:hypothetical protein [Caproiciproducens sp. MSJ-32]|uniref:hypothetical protein n=1 Tax=Caproiciproducens sp. MSJ-32 TaxID=2841527 RepID=UPI001C0F8BE3|nr:hypothetical protein [Caproiciproducens sp. MSJ-32]MBU5454279.1 hypothetical protein [Caproiciproducens sp. MSJ-32]